MSIYKSDKTETTASGVEVRNGREDNPRFRRIYVEALSKQDVLDAIPNSWLDPMLTGPDRLLPTDRPASNRDIEKMFQAIKTRINALPIIKLK